MKPHAPQFVRSVDRLTQTELHSVVGAGQVALQRLPPVATTHAGVTAVQRTSHAPHDVGESSLASHPFDASASQLANEERHAVVRSQRPATQRVVSKTLGSLRQSTRAQPHDAAVSAMHTPSHALDPAGQATSGASGGRESTGASVLTTTTSGDAATSIGWATSWVSTRSLPGTSSSAGITSSDAIVSSPSVTAVVSNPSAVFESSWRASAAVASPSRASISAA